MNGAEPGRVAIILVNWNAWRDTVECVSSILASDAAGVADVYVVDNDSSDGSVERIEQWCREPRPVADYARFEGVRHIGPQPIACRVVTADGRAAAADPAVQLTLVRAGANLGFAGGNNVGIQAAGLERYGHFWLLNTDTVMRHDALHQLLERAAAGPAVGMVGSTLLYYHRPDCVQAMGGGRLDRRTTAMHHIGAGVPAAAVSADAAAVEGEMAYVVGASMLVSAEMVRRIGPMQSDYFLYFEEIDWAFRARPRFELGYAPRSVIFHKEGGSSAKVASTFSLNLLYRNRLRFVGRFMPDRLAAARRVLALELLRNLAKGRWTAARLVAAALRDSGRLADAEPAMPSLER